jgi:hypothetical protein
MPTPEERERAERSVAGSDPVPATDILALQTLMDMERALGRLETAVEGLERSTAQHAKDLNGLGKAAHTASTFGKIALGLATPVAASITIAFLVLIYHLVVRLFSLFSHP